MDNELETKEVYKKLSKSADDSGFYLIPNSLYNQMFNLIESQRIEIKELKKSRDSWKAKLKAEKENK